MQFASTSQIGTPVGIIAIASGGMSIAALLGVAYTNRRLNIELAARDEIIKRLSTELEAQSKAISDVKNLMKMLKEDSLKTKNAVRELSQSSASDAIDEKPTQRAGRRVRAAPSVKDKELDSFL